MGDKRQRQLAAELAALRNLIGQFIGAMTNMNIRLRALEDARASTDNTAIVADHSACPNK